MKLRTVISTAVCLIYFATCVSCVVAPSVDIDFSTITAIFFVIQDFGQGEGTAFAQFKIGEGVPSTVIELTQGETVSVNETLLSRSANILDFLGPVYTAPVPRQDPPDGLFTFQFIDSGGGLSENSVTPPEPTEIAIPVEAAQLSLSQPLQIEWTPATMPEETDTVRIEVNGPDADDPTLITTLTLNELTDDPGTLTLSDLTGFAAGEGSIRLERVREVAVMEGFKDGTASLIQRHEISVTFVD